MTRARRIAAVHVAALAVSAGAAAMARADTPETLFERASDAMDAHAYVEACALFDESYALSRATGPLIGLATCYEARGLLRQSILLWREAERTLPPESPNLADARTAVLRLQSRIARITVRLAPEAPSSTRVELDGEVIPVGSTPLEIDPAVNHAIVAVAPGFSPSTVNLRLGEGEHREVSIAPEPVAPTASIGPVRGTGIGLLVLGGVGLATASVTGGIMIADALTIARGCDRDHANCDAEAVSASASAHALAPWNVASWVVGLAAIGAAVPMMVVGDRHRDDQAAFVVRGSWLGVAGRF